MYLLEKKTQKSFLQRKTKWPDLKESCWFIHSFVSNILQIQGAALMQTFAKT